MAEYIIPSNYEGKMVAAERLIRCCECVNWQTGVAYVATGRCKLHDRITNRNYFCADGADGRADHV